MTMKTGVFLAPGLRSSLFLALSLALVSPSAAQPCPPCPGDDTDPDPQELRVYFGYLHAHTSYSDGQGTPLEAYVHARDLGGLDFLAITPHNHSSAGQIAARPDLYNGPGPDSLISIANAVTVDGEFVALYGQEFSSISKGNHVNVIDAPTVITVENGSYDSLLDDYIANNKDSFGNDCLLVLNHPDSGPRQREYGRDDFGTEAEWVRRIGAIAPVINLINGPSHSSGTASIPAPAEGSFRFFLNKGFRLAPSIDQDNHQRTWGTIHDGRTAVVANELTKRAILDGLRARHVYATTDRNLRIVCTVEDGQCGDVFPAPAAGSAISAALAISDDDEPNAVYQVSVFADQVGGPPLDFTDPIEEVFLNGNGALTLPPLQYPGGRAYFVVKVTQFHESDDTGIDSDQAWLAPFWIEPALTEESLLTEISPLDSFSTPVLAHVDSEVFHSTTCPQAQALQGAEDTVTGEQAINGRRPHAQCTGVSEDR